MKAQIRGIILNCEYSDEFGNSDVTFQDLETKTQFRVSLKEIDFRAADEMSYLIPRDYLLDGVKVFSSRSRKNGDAYTQISATGIHAQEIALPAPSRPAATNGQAKPEKAQA